MKTVDLQKHALVAVMGATGSGKSTFINLVSGSEMRIGSGLQSCTIEVATTMPFEFEGCSVVLIDTPGFDDTNKSDTEILKLIAAFLATSYEYGLKLAGIIYMHRISDVRMGGTSVRNFKMFRKLCGTKSLKNVVLVANMWNTIPQETAVARELQLATSDQFFKPVLDEGAQFLRHTNTFESACVILQHLVHSTPVVIQIQQELVDEKKNIEETMAGSELRREFVELEERHKRDLQELKAEMEKAMRERDEVTRKEYQEEIDRLDENMRHIRSDNENMAAKYDEEKKRLQDLILELDGEAKRLSQSQQNQAEFHKKRMEEIHQASAAESFQMLARISELQSRLTRERRVCTGCVIG